ncbi:hypothetical protein BT63DRAFT_425848 [Microthyrium microscopicum]|uniref:Endoplasmic reticulum protein n=1 Tax=Microthyrium microscopicum TaxID=703497 RepID=A0A6A6UAR8_9PEZI|nr:hypothetical protein BT63DRAFT_425848 [Microthyrium microscopicum]
MANPTPAPLQERALRLVQSLQFAWFCGHVSMLFFTLRYGLYYITMKTGYTWARYSYRIAFVSALVTYGIVVYKGYRARVRQGKPTSAIALASDENVQYYAMGLIWLFSRQIPLALLPFVVYSVFHVLTYIRGNILPTLTPPTAPSPAGQRPRPSGPVADGIGKFIKDYYDLSMSLVAGLEIALWVRVFVSALLFQKGSWILLAIYSVFLRARYSQSTFVQNTFATIGARADGVLANQSTDPTVRRVWDQVKGGLKQLVEMTDAKKYVGQAPGEGAKKAQ